MSDYNDGSNGFGGEPYQTFQETAAPVVEKKGMGIASLVLGIISVITGCCCFFIGLGLILGVLAVIFGIIFLKANKGKLVSKGFGISGIILGVIGILLTVIIWVYTLVSFRASGISFDEFIEQIEQEVEINMEY